MRILLTNDDGIEADGLWRAREELLKLGEVWIVAPDRDQSGVSQSLTLRHPIRVEERKERIFVVSGTPTDCVLLAYHHFVKGKIDLIVAGINHGYNMGYDVFYSGTVAAALQGGILRITSLAVSTEDIGSAQEHLIPTIEMAVAEGEKYVLNVNIPKGPKGYRITRLGRRIYNDEVIKREEERGIGYYVIDGTLSFEVDSGTDFEAIKEGYISITPLNLDLTDHKIFHYLQKRLNG
ncbi:5'/3'-nucleotidase SurE [candidate division WOR-3 bacterium]|uniref:5'-nucleotidase SurE n=1 Tax=candidate division WOR-3 bacterium TaxID=2052148 RepID=A0A660SGE0_UNCW3|nr:MAG: 5'/3'-nucleotidase SurE [candidate division WOR-3 bacterium]